MKEVVTIYDTLFAFEARNRNSHYPIHKKLGKETLVNWLLKRLSLSAGDRVLDAGCGTGHVLFTLHSAFGISGTGLSLSPSEVAFAGKQAKKQGTANQLVFKVQDFSGDLSALGRFKLILCLESLKHVSSPIATINSLLKLLEKDGQLIVVDDFLQKKTPVDLIKAHATYWSTPGFMSIEDLRNTLSEQIQHSEDLTEHVPVKSRFKLNVLIFCLKAIKPFLSTDGKTYRHILTYLGALYLEYLYRIRTVGYFALFIEEKNTKS